MRSNSSVPSESELPSSAGVPRPALKRTVDRWISRWLLRSMLLVVTAASLLDLYEWRYGKINIFEPKGGVSQPVPLVMEGGDPHIRALMRTISASESNVAKPYSVMYGGEHFKGWNRHPDKCVSIPVGPNRGNCSTAAGRYQFITTTWEAEAQRYHPEQPKILFWRPYPFDPQSQDVVTYRWLSDASAWGTDLSDLLRNGEVEQVLEILSPTWTSLGYGIETNSMSAYLPEIYFELLDEELAALAAQDAVANQLEPVQEPLRTDAEAGGAREIAPENGESSEAIASQTLTPTLSPEASPEDTSEAAPAPGWEEPGERRSGLGDGLADLRSGTRKLLKALLRRS